jgi:hypothetical protein
MWQWFVHDMNIILDTVHCLRKLAVVPSYGDCLLLGLRRKFFLLLCIRTNKYDCYRSCECDH